MTEVERYIADNWRRSVRTADLSWGEKEGRIGLPKPFTTPSSDGRYRDLYYWDTYFTNVGLLAMNETDMAENNLDDLAYLIDRLGFVPNSNVISTFNRSQPPLFCRGVNDLYIAKGKDVNVIKKYVGAIEKEYYNYRSWHETPVGLWRYSLNNNSDTEYLQSFYDEIAARIPFSKPEAERAAFAVNLVAEAESGWDFTPRFGFRAHEYAAVDLNGLVYETEVLLSEYFAMLGQDGKSDTFARFADQRRQRIDALMRDGEGIYYDYDFKNNVRGKYVTSAAFVPYSAGVSRDRAGLLSVLSRLECEYGIAAVEKNDFSTQILQWDYPNMWAPLVYFAYTALIRCGLDREAGRVAGKYMAAVDEGFRRKGMLFEKYDATTGHESYHNEYSLCEMMGWTMGVYAFLSKATGR